MRLPKRAALSRRQQKVQCAMCCENFCSLVLGQNRMPRTKTWRDGVQVGAIYPRGRRTTLYPQMEQFLKGLFGEAIKKDCGFSDKAWLLSWSAYQRDPSGQFQPRPARRPEGAVSRLWRSYGRTSSHEMQVEWDLRMVPGPHTNRSRRSPDARRRGKRPARQRSLRIADLGYFDLDSLRR